MAEKFRQVSLDLVEVIVHRRDVLTLQPHAPGMFMIILWEEGEIQWQSAALVPEIRWLPYLTRSAHSVVMAVVDAEDGAHWFRRIPGRIEVLLRGEWSANRMIEGRVLRESLIRSPIET